MHVVEPEGIGRGLAHFRAHPLMGAVGRLLFLHLGRKGIARRISRSGPCAAGILPLRLCRQTVGLSCLLGEPLAVSDSIVPCDVDHGHVVLEGEFVRTALTNRFVRRIKALVLEIGNLSCAHPEGRKRNLVGRSLIVVLSRSAFRAHRKRPGRYLNHIGEVNDRLFGTRSGSVGCVGRNIRRRDRLNVLGRTGHTHGEY